MNAEYLRKNLKLSILMAGAILAGSASAGPAAAENILHEPQYKVDPSLPSYAPSVKIEKALTSIGSDSMGDLVDRWAEAYGKLQPVAIKVEHQGSASAPAALIEGSADIGPMARPMKQTERSGFVARYGFQPTQVRTAIAAVAIYVNKQNPLNEISFDELNAIYSAQPKSGLTRPSGWSELGRGSKDLAAAPGDPAVYPIAASADPYAFAYFRQQVLVATDLDPSVATTGDVGSMLELVAAKPNAIGFGLLTSPPPGVKILAVRRASSERAVMPAAAELEKDGYPLGRFLNVYLVRDPGAGKGVDDEVRDFLSFVLSKQGQTLVAKEGLMPLSHKLVNEERSRLGL